MALESQIATIVRANGAEFYDTERVTEGEQTIYRVYVTQEGGISLDLCAEISRELSVLLDVTPPMGGNYILEVSSPGLERKLTKPKHFKHSIGEKVKVKVLGGDKLKGILKSADDEGVVIDTKEDDKAFKYSELGTVKTYFEL